MTTRRMERVNSILKRAISEVLQKNMHHRGLPSLISVTNVDTSKDLRNAHVFISIIDNDNKTNKLEALDILQKASGYIASLASKLVKLKYFPSLTFKVDDSAEKYMEIDSLLKKCNKKDDEKTEE